MYVDGQPQGVTPAKVELVRKDKHDIRVEMPGYETCSAILRPGVNPWVFGNLLLGGLIGAGIDAVTGSWATLSPMK